MFNLSADDFTQVVGDLHPFATYRFDVRAITSVGPGNRTSQTNTTAEDGKLCGRDWEGQREIKKVFKKEGGKVLREDSRGGRERWRVVEIQEEGGSWKTERRFNRAGKSDKLV